MVQTHDGGETWSALDGGTVVPPLTCPKIAALVRDYASEGRLVYLHNVCLDARGDPAVLYSTSSDPRPGPGGSPRHWEVASWDGGNDNPDTMSPSNLHFCNVSGDAVWRLPYTMDEDYQKPERIR
ncbi:hypothetical protein SH580_05975 [Coraliomargarita algicola]|uniref:Glycosyl hydrolase n=1 Tax=Coraliomargarita algicola TaxID=3092156 RepID=A0ABZ0RPT9_9BACT|nr:hypothetical protein [Coraliomargarita sp. J2-16]WPJ97254.1 hypothetical protein SH580_05975 [Coraliomargarita sp. J2-16]